MKISKQNEREKYLQLEKLKTLKEGKKFKYRKNTFKIVRN